MSDKDSYEILGLRPNAGHDEIELAYKGRRSQYHPDRYAQSDAETLAWATAKMQDVNEAYRVLASPELRAECDRRTSSSSSAKRRPEGRAAAPADDVRDAASVLLNSGWRWFHDKVYARPNIPRTKLESAISSYAPEVSQDEAIVLLDDTLFGGAKEGLLVTNNAIYCKQKFESPRRVTFNDIQQVEMGSNSRVIVNGKVFFKADLIEHLAVATFAARLSKVFKPATVSTDGRPAATRKASGVDSLRVLHRGAMAALRAELETKTFRIDELIDRQMRCIAEQFSELRNAVEWRRRQHPRHAHGSVDAEGAELALMLFLILHYYGFSKLPSAFKKAGGQEFTRLHAVSEVYKVGFREGFALVFERSMELDEEDLLMMSAVFFHGDGEGEFELTMSREEALSDLFPRLGIRRETAKKLIRQFEDHVEWWFNAIAIAAAQQR